MAMALRTTVPLILDLVLIVVQVRFIGLQLKAHVLLVSSLTVEGSVMATCQVPPDK
jgi:hypothetical protein